LGEIVNLRRQRKRRQRAEAEEVAAANRVTHGTPKSLRDLAKARREKADRDLDGKKTDQD
jgi:hypothetical protein